MKSIFSTCAVMLSLLLGACQKNENTHEKPTSQMVVSQEIIRDTVTNQEGEVLAMAFNNPKQIATLVWQGETIELKQCQMASGIKYTNPVYELTEHQGELTLEKGGKVVFNHKK